MQINKKFRSCDYTTMIKDFRGRLLSTNGCFFSSRRRHTRWPRDWSSDVCSSDLGADLVIETVPENLELKIRVFREIEAQVADECLLASDTSGIPITKIQAGTRVPGRVIGMHWSNPPHIIPMIEVIAGEQTAPGAVASLAELIRRIGHLPIIIRKDVAG